MKKVITLSVSILCFMVLMLQSCQEDEFEVLSEEHHETVQKKITFEEFKERIRGKEIPDAFLKNSITPNQILSNSPFSDTYVNSISEEDVLVISKEENTTYTLKVQTDDNSKNTNLLVSEKEGQVYTDYIEYSEESISIIDPSSGLANAVFTTSDIIIQSQETNGNTEVNYSGPAICGWEIVEQYSGWGSDAELIGATVVPIYCEPVETIIIIGSTLGVVSLPYQGGVNSDTSGGSSGTSAQGSNTPPRYLTSEYGRDDEQATLASEILSDVELPTDCLGNLLLQFDISDLEMIKDIQESIAEETFLELLIDLCEGELTPEQFLQELREEYLKANILQSIPFKNTDLDCLFEKMIDGDIIPNSNTETKDIIKDLLTRFAKENGPKLVLHVEDLDTEVYTVAGENPPDAVTTKLGDNYQIIFHQDVFDTNFSTIKAFAVIIHELMHVNMIADLEAWGVITGWNEHGTTPMISSNLCTYSNNLPYYATPSFFRADLTAEELDRAEWFAETYCRWKLNSSSYGSHGEWYHRLFESWHPTQTGSEVQSFRAFLENYILEYITQNEPNLYNQTTFPDTNANIAERLSWGGLTRVPEFLLYAEEEFPDIFAEYEYDNLNELTHQQLNDLYYYLGNMDISSNNYGAMLSDIETKSEKINEICNE